MYRERRRAAGLCYACGKNPPSPGPQGGMLCSSCRAIQESDSVRKYKEDYKRKRYLELKRKCFDLYGKTCNHCGEDDQDVLEFHHTIGSAREDVERYGPADKYWKKLSEKKKENIVVLCANCHRRLHKERSLNDAEN